jgi:EmrB/QacA subfamily drug resistance transporter
VCLGNFMLLLDVTVVNVALPRVADDFDTSFGSLQWVVDGYTLALAALVLAAGSVADVLDHRRTYLLGLVVFAASSLASALSPGASALVAARAVQGVGGAAMLATSFALLNVSYEGRRRGVAYGVWGAVSGGASAIGPLVGGVLTDVGSWRWVFLVNLPISALALVVAALSLRPTGGGRDVRTLDVPGVVAFSAATAALTTGLIAADEHGWSAPRAWVPLAAAPLLLLVFVVVEARVRRPLLDLALLRRPAFVGVMVGALSLTFAAFATYPYVSIWLQSVAGLSAVQAGSATVPLSATAFVVALGTARYVHRVGAVTLAGVGLLLVGAGGLVNAGLVHGSAGWATMVPGFVVTGLGAGMATPTLGAAAAGSVPLARAGMAAGVLNTMRQLGLALGVAILGGVFAGRVTEVLAGHGVADPAEVGRQVSAGQAGQVLGSAAGTEHAATGAVLQAAAVSGVQASFLVCGLAGVLAGALVLALHRPVRVATLVEEPAAG